MSKAKFFIIFILLVIVLGVGFWFKEDIEKLSKSFNTSIQEFRIIDVGSVVSEIGKEVLTSSPLNVGGESNEVVLLKSKIVSETNAQRTANGLPKFIENKQLESAASIKANDMFKNQYFEHISPTGINPGILVENSGYEYIVTGENLILGNFENEAEVVQDWMNSPGHRANILNTSYTEIGVSIIKGVYKGETVWISVQEFGLPLSACSEPSKNLKTQIEAQQSEIEFLGETIDEQKNEIDNTNKNSAYYNNLIDDYNDMVERYNSLAQELKITVANYNNQVNVFNDCVSNAQSK